VVDLALTRCLALQMVVQVTIRAVPCDLGVVDGGPPAP